MEDWRFGVVANIAEYHTAENGVVYRGTKAFTAGTKVYVDGKHWAPSRKEISVIGRNRFGKIVLESIPTECVYNIRAQRIYRPTVLAVIDHLAAVDGWQWWGRTSADRKEAAAFVKAWKATDVTGANKDTEQTFTGGQL